MNGITTKYQSMRRSTSWICREVYWQTRCRFMEGLLAMMFKGKDVRRAAHIKQLEARVRDLRRKVTEMQRVVEDRNRQLVATNLIVGCTGCDAGSPPDMDAVTEDVVASVEEIAKRLRSWFVNHEGRKRRAGEAE